MFRKRGLANESGAFHVFDRRAAGVVLGEGCGMALLKPLDRALADGDVIHAVVEAVAVNNDGRTAGPSAPNVAAQAAVMAAALTRAGRNAGEIGYLEVNGSGSEVTDLLELKAIAAAYGAPRSQPLQLGSVKPNIGHPLCAEGIAGFIKVAAMLSHGVTVPCLSGAEPMVHADFAAANAAMAEVGGSFPEDSPVAAINVFADGGTNAHAILSAWRDERDPAQLRQPLPPAATHRTPMPVPGEPAPNLSAGADFDLPRRNFWAQ
jgi:polyketide synthase PksL